MGNNIQLIIILIFLGISGISWVLRKLQEKAAERALEERRKRREDEYLRTGRTSDEGMAARPVDSADAQAKLRELAAKRQAQLRELRQKKSPQPAEPRAEEAASAKGESVRVEMWPGGPVIEIGPQKAAGRGSPKPAPPAAAQPARPKPVAGPIAQQTPREFAEAEQERHVRKVRQAAEAAATAARADFETEAREERQRTARYAKANAAATKAARARPEPRPRRQRDESVMDLVGASPAEWRRAIVLSELLARPVSERDEPHTF